MRKENVINCLILAREIDKEPILRNEQLSLIKDKKRNKSKCFFCIFNGEEHTMYT